MLTKAEIENGMAGFTGTEEYHRISMLFPRFLLTDGAIWLAKNAECFWLFEAIASYQPKCLRDAKLRDMQFWTLTVKDGKATLKVERDSGDPSPLVVKRIGSTSFPLEEVKIWVAPTATERGEAMVAYLPSEH
jgi:hypothetical protein